MTLRLPQKNVGINVNGNDSALSLSPTERRAIASLGNPDAEQILAEAILSSRRAQANFERLAQEFPIQPENVADSLRGGEEGELPVEAPGDLITADEEGEATVLPVGGDGTVLLADSSESLGLRWGNVLQPSSREGELGAVELTQESGHFELPAVPGLILAFTAFWGGGENRRIEDMSIGGFSLAQGGASFNTFYKKGPGLTILYLEPAGRLSPGRVSYEIEPPVEGIPFRVALFFISTPGKMSFHQQTPNTPTREKVERETASITPTESTFLLLSYITLGSESGGPPTVTSRSEDVDLLWSASSPMYDAEGNLIEEGNLGSHGYVEFCKAKDLEPVPHSTRWTFGEKVQTGGSITSYAA